MIWLCHGHRYWLAVAVLIGAKLFATAVVGRILSVCHPTLSRLAWFRRADDWVRLTRNRIHGAIKSTALWQAGARLKRQIIVWAPFAHLRRRAERAP